MHTAKAAARQTSQKLEPACANTREIRHPTEVGGELVRLLPGNQLQWTMESLTAASAGQEAFYTDSFHLPFPFLSLQQIWKICNLITLTTQLTLYSWKKVIYDGAVS